MNIELRADDGGQLSAYVARPQGAASKAVIVIQEIFGVNRHIRSVADGYAGDRFLAVAPAMFDRAQRGVELGYDAAGRERGMALARQIPMDDALRDVAAAIDYAAKQVGAKHVGVVGYCWGGTVAWLAATRLTPAASVGYYGGRIAQYAAEKPRCPVMLHFGGKDAHILQSDVERIRGAHPEVAIYTYDAGHGFNCNDRAEYEPKSAALARERTLEFFQKRL
jgi:carboxymethylenebutenolidase